MDLVLLCDDQWKRIKVVLSKMRDDKEKTDENQRLLIEAIRCSARTGAPWRDLLISFGNGNKNYKKKSRWIDNGTWKRIKEAVSDDSMHGITKQPLRLRQ